MIHLAAIDKPFIPAWAELRGFAPELCLIATIIAMLIVPFFTRRSNLTCAAVALAGLVVGLASAVWVGWDDSLSGFYLRGLLIVDPISIFWKMILFLFVIGIILMWFSTTAATMHEGDGPEFFTLLLGATLGMSLMASTSNLLMIFMCVELASLPSYVLAGFRKTHRVGAEASLKYVLFGAATSSIMAYGLSLLYGLCGSLQVDEIAKVFTSESGSPALLAVALAGLIIGIGFKISAVPFHFWCPDVFEGASIDISAFLSVASKGAGLILLLRVLMSFAESAGYQNTPGLSLTALAIVIGLIGAITATVGNTGAFVQNNIKRLLAYSSIAHAGYMVCALSLIVIGNDRDLQQHAAEAILLYLAVYLFMNLGAFTVAGLIHRSTGSEQIDDYEGLSRRNPILALCMAACLISMIGLPPLAGFIAKLRLMLALGANGGWWWSLVAVIGVNTIFSVYYYARVLRVMYLLPSDRPPVRAHPVGLLLSALCVVVLVAMLIGFAPVNWLTTRYGRFHNGVAGDVPAMPQVSQAQP